MSDPSFDRKVVTLNVASKILEEIRNGGVEQGHSVAEMLLSEGPDFEPELLVVLVESVVELTAQSGTVEAREYLENMWPTLKDRHLKRLAKKKNRNSD